MNTRKPERPNGSIDWTATLLDDATVASRLVSEMSYAELDRVAGGYPPDPCRG
jgi:hypothetical protein